MKDKKDFAVFILTHGRPNNVKTYKTLQKAGYTGKVYIIIDNEDKTQKEYLKKFNNKVIVFDKKEVSKTFDEADNFDDRRAIVYARNACFSIAKDLNITYFLQLDDDYTEFAFRFNLSNEYKFKGIKNNLDQVFESVLMFYKSVPVLSIAFAQGGDFIGGDQSGFAKKITLKRKCMNTFFCSTKRPFKFIGRINEDVNTYTCLQSRGNVFLTINAITIDQLQTQNNKGGMTDIYLDQGTYVKSFYTVIHSPSCTKIALMGQKNRRLHHKISWPQAVPLIISEEHKK